MSDFLFAGAALVSAITPVIADTTHTKLPYLLDLEGMTDPRCIVYFRGFRVRSGTQRAQILEQFWLISVFHPDGGSSAGGLLGEVIDAVAFKTLPGAYAETVLADTPEPEPRDNAVIYHLGITVPVFVKGA